MTDITVLMPVWNAEAYLREAIKSILSQSYKNFVFLIIDDGSTDETAKIVKSFKDKRIKFIHHNKNIGLTRRLNEGLTLTKTKYLARMDADDVAVKNRFRFQRQFLVDNPEYALIGSNYQKITSEGKNLCKSNYPTDYNAIKKSIMKANVFSHSCLLINTKILRAMGGYDETFYLSQDYELCLRITASHLTCNLKAVLMKDRLSKGALSHTKKTRQALMALKAQWYGITRYNYSLVNLPYLLRSAAFVVKTLF